MQEGKKPEDRSPYRRALFYVQRASNKDRTSAGSMALDNVIVLIAGVAGAVGAILFRGYIPTRTFVFGYAMTRGGTLALLVGLGAITVVVSLLRIAGRARELSRPARPISCPRCGNGAHLFDQVELFVCPGCELPLRRRPGAASDPLTLRACAHCSAAVGAPAQVDDLPCPSCRAPIGGGGEPGAEPSHEEHLGRLTELLVTSASPAAANSTADVRVDPGVEKAAEHLLALSRHATLDEARAQLRRGEALLSGPDAPAEFLRVQPTALACLQLQDCARDETLRDRAIELLREADRIHARFARAAADAPPTGTAMAHRLASTYLSQRNELIDELVPRPDLPNVAELKLGVGAGGQLTVEPSELLALAFALDPLLARPFRTGSSDTAAGPGAS